MTADHDKFMHRAITLAKRATGRTSPNPLVGCVIVKGGKIIAEGWHKACGADHAEVMALKKAGDGVLKGTLAKGAVMYVTLEPCAHWGHTPPCVDAVLAAGIKKVVVAMKDPNPLTNGKSIGKLRAHGVEVITGVCGDEAREMNAAFIKYVTRKMPYVVIKTAQTLDGKAGTRSGKVRWITSEQTRQTAKSRRHEFDAIVVGINTVLADDPCLCAPGRQIVKVVVDSRLKIPLGAKLFHGALPGQVVVATTAKASPAKMAALWKKGARVMICPARGGRVDLGVLFKELAKNGLIRILVEGGPTLVGAVLKAGLADRAHIYMAPKMMGDTRDAVRGVDLGALIAKADIVCVEPIGRDLFIEVVMFTGIVEAIGKVKELRKRENLYTLVVTKPRFFNDVKVGDSIANDGACLTVTAVKDGCFYFDLMKETLDATTLKHLVPGKGVNLERAMKADARMGGHFVTGHVDAVGRITDIRTMLNYVEFRVSVPRNLMRYIVPKGSAAIDGISLTVGEVKKDWFAVYFIPHTLQVTTIGEKKKGDEVNIETDLLAKYILKARG